MNFAKAEEVTANRHSNTASERLIRDNPCDVLKEKRYDRHIPCAAASLNHFTAVLSSCGTPIPSSYIKPRLNWAIEGCLLWQSEGLTPPVSVAASSREYRSEMDTVASFIEDECRMDQSLKVSVSSLYEHYVSWCKSQDRHPRTKVQFGKELTSKSYEQIRGGTGRFWQGLTTNLHMVV